jgi:hypothetical protein
VKTYIIDGKNRIGVSFYSQIESTRRIKLVFREKSCDAYQSMFFLEIGEIFNIVCIEGAVYYYKKCKFIETGEHNVPVYRLEDQKNIPQYVLFECEQITNGVDNEEVSRLIRKEKLNNIKNLTV